MMFKKIASFALAATVGLSVAAFGGCKPKAPDTEETLEVYCMKAGYGSEWCESMLELFQQQDWVKEKYPNLNVVYSSNDIQNFAESKLNSGRKANTVDLLFGATLQSFAGPGGEIADLTDLVYNTQVPGENVTFKDKCNSSYNDSNRYIDVTDLDGDPRWYTVSWCGGMNTFIYNETMLNQYKIKVPNTTNEMLTAFATLKSNGKYSLIQSKDADYFSYLFPVWWAQYEGITEYLNFWNGISGNRYSVNIFNQKGREKSLEVYRDFLNYSKGYLALSSFTGEFMEQQTLFLKGGAAFHVNGDWFDNEMRAISEELKKESGKLDVFKTMKMPIVSALGEKLGITDAQLSAIVDYVDGAVEAKPEFASTTDYSEDEVIAAVREARSIVSTIGPNHTAVIPDYANGKEVAADFLRFMATDIALEDYIRVTGGASLPFDYNLKEKNIALYNQIGTLQQSRHDYFDSDKYDIYSLPSNDAFPLARYGGLKAFVTETYYTTFSANNNKKTPHDFMQETLNAWTQSKWENACSKAGIAL